MTDQLSTGDLRRIIEADRSLAEFARYLPAATKLHTAAKRGDADRIRACIADGMDVRAEGAGGMTPLHYAAHYGHAEAAQVLLDAGAGFRVKDRKGLTPRDRAEQRGHTAVVKLIDAKADSEKDGNTPLHFAVILGDESEAARLTHSDIDINAQNRIGRTALHYAAHLPHPERIVKLLLAAGADAAVKDGRGRTALEIARGNHNHAAAAALADQAAESLSSDDLQAVVGG